MAYADILFLDDCSDDPDQIIGQDIDQIVDDLVRSFAFKLCHLQREQAAA